MNENSHTYVLQYDVLEVKKIIRVYLVNADGISPKIHVKK